MAEEKQLSKEEQIAILEKENEDIVKLQKDIKEVSNKTDFPNPTAHLAQAFKTLKNCHFYFDAHRDGNQILINKLNKG